MNQIDQFTRRETMELTGATSNQLQYLERSGLVKPTKIWNGKKKPDVYYTWQQILEIRAIRNLRETTSLQVIRKIINFFEKYQVDSSLRDKQIIVINGEVFWINQNWSDFAEKISELKVDTQKDKGVGQYTLLVVPAFRDIVNEISDIAKQSELISFENIKQKVQDELNNAA